MKSLLAQGLDNDHGDHGANAVGDSSAVTHTYPYVVYILLLGVYILSGRFYP